MFVTLAQGVECPLAETAHGRISAPLSCTVRRVLLEVICHGLFCREILAARHAKERGRVVATHRVFAAPTSSRIVLAAPAPLMRAAGAAVAPGASSTAAPPSVQPAADPGTCPLGAPSVAGIGIEVLVQQSPRGERLLADHTAVRRAMRRVRHEVLCHMSFCRKRLAASLAQKRRPVAATNGMIKAPSPARVAPVASALCVAFAARRIVLAAAAVATFVAAAPGAPVASSSNAFPFAVTAAAAASHPLGTPVRAVAGVGVEVSEQLIFRGKRLLAEQTREFAAF